MFDAVCRVARMAGDLLQLPYTSPRQIAKHISEIFARETAHDSAISDSEIAPIRW